MPRNLLIPVLALALAAPSMGCSIRKMALRATADGLTGGTGGSFARDDDPELVGAAIPFALKTMESLADSLDDHVGLRLALASGFTQYAYAWVQWDAEQLETKDPKRAQAIRARAARLFKRGRDYGLEGLLISKGITLEDLRGDTARRKAALTKLEIDDVPMLYWTLVPWAAAISADKRNLELVGDLPLIAEMLDRALVLDEAWDHGTLHEFSLAFDGARSIKPSREQEDKHYARALELTKGQRLSVKVSYAEQVLAPAQDKKAYLALLDEVLAFDVNAKDVRDQRLANTFAQRRAKYLKEHLDDLFLDE